MLQQREKSIITSLMFNISLGCYGYTFPFHVCRYNYHSSNNNLMVCFCYLSLRVEKYRNTDKRKSVFLHSNLIRQSLRAKDYILHKHIRYGLTYKIALLNNMNLYDRL